MPIGEPAVRKPPAPRKHLMTPGSPRPQRQEPMSLSRVQRWVASTLVSITILHLSAGLVLAAVFADRLSAQIGLLVIAGAFGFLAVLAPVLIHKRRLINPWFLLAPAPSLVGAYFIWF